MRKGQSKKMSLVETWSNIVIGYFIALLTQVVVFPLYGWDIPVKENLQIGMIFAVVSFVRGYTLRRVFNYIFAKE